ncbi:MAG: Uma2 family endonuclease [Gemmatimonadaceae bacterium]
MPAAHADWTVEMLDALPEDGRRYEIVDGALYVTPAPSDVHQLVAAEFYKSIDAYLRPTTVARALFSPADVRKDDKRRNRVQPDVFAVRLAGGKRPPYPYALSDLLIAIEVESPSNPFLDYQVKRELYLTNGVAEYWIASPESRVVTACRSDRDPGAVFREMIEWHPIGMSEPLVIDLAALFDEALR